jgi:hypothetical protein
MSIFLLKLKLGTAPGPGEIHSLSHKRFFACFFHLGRSPSASSGVLPPGTVAPICLSSVPSFGALWEKNSTAGSDSGLSPCPVLFSPPQAAISLSMLEWLDWLSSAGSNEDAFCLHHTRVHMHASHFDSTVPQLMHNVPLPGKERIDLLHGLSKTRIIIGGDQLPHFAGKSPAFQVDKKCSPGVIILLIN